MSLSMALLPNLLNKGNDDDASTYFMGFVQRLKLFNPLATHIYSFPDSGQQRQLYMKDSTVPGTQQVYSVCCDYPQPPARLNRAQSGISATFLPPAPPVPIFPALMNDRHLESQDSFLSHSTNIY